MTTLELDGVTKVYDDARGTERAVDEVSLTVPDGEFAVVVGPSGCGKSTTLRTIAGLEPVTEGAIRLDGREVQDLAPSERDVAMVFQNYALYPNMTGRENMAYGLKHAAGLGREEREATVAETAELLDIADVVDKRPGELSGGQKQRVALGRAIVRDPNVFLLDEPLSNLDAKLRAEMRHELQRIQEDLGITTVYVTHDQKEAMTMADRIAVMRDGRLQQVDDPETAYDRPVNQFVGEFLGSPSMNTLPASVHRDGDRVTLAFLDGGLTLDAATLDAPATDGGHGAASRAGDGTGAADSTGSAEGDVVVGVRPEDFDVVDAGEGAVTADVVDAEYQGAANFVFAEAGDATLTVRSPRHVRPERGDHVGLAAAPEDVYVFDPETGASLRVRP